MCNKCIVEKDIANFNFRSDVGKYRKTCQDCRNTHRRSKRAENSDHARKVAKDWYANNKEKVCNQRKEYYKSNKDKILRVRSVYVHNNLDKVSATNKTWRDKNKDYLREYMAKYVAYRSENDLEFKIKTRIRQRLGKAIKRNYKSSSAIILLGCSISYFKRYLESKFQDNMTWENYGDWHMDHIIPLSKFDLTNNEHLLKACHYTNLQPLWAKDNISKGAK